MSTGRNSTKGGEKPGVGRFGSLGAKLALSLAVAVVALLAGCAAYRPLAGLPVASGAKAIAPDYAQIIGSGQPVTRQMNVGNFLEVEARSAFTVHLQQSESPTLEITADDNVIDHVQVVRRGQTLILALKPGSYTRATYRATLGVPDLRGISLSEATTAIVSDFRPEGGLRLELAGASTLTGRFQVSDLAMVAREASAATVGGSAERLTLIASGSSKTSLGDLAVGKARAELREASTALLNVKERLDADLNSASTLTYVGNPTLGEVSSTGASSLKRR
jgi:hypothetical protein